MSSSASSSRRSRQHASNEFLITNRVRTRRRVNVTLNGYPVTLHLARPATTPRLPLLIYATGDGGWRGKDLDLFRHLTSWGYPIAGFSAPEYVKHLSGDAETTTPARLARDYERHHDVGQAVADAAVVDARHPGRCVRGAGLSVVAAGQEMLQPLLDGVVAMGLTREEEHVRWRRRRESTELKIYDYLPRLGPMPMAVIQSTRDNYLPSDIARVLFGSDTDRRQVSRDRCPQSQFAGARPLLYRNLALGARVDFELATSSSIIRRRR